MTTNSRLAGAMVVIVLASSIVGYAGFRAARAAEVSREIIAKKQGTLELEIRRLKAAKAGIDQRTRKTETSPRESPWRVTAGESHSPHGPYGWAITARGAYMIRTALAAYRARLANKYGALYQSLRLTPAEIDAFEASLTGHAETMYDLQAVAMADGLNESGPEIAALNKQADEELRAEQTALLGDSGYRQLQQFIRAGPIQGFVDTIAGHASFPPEPLTETQAQQLAVVLEDASSSYQNGDPADPVTIDWSAVLAPAQGILSANQLHGLKASIDQIKLDQFRRQFFQEQGPK